MRKGGVGVLVASMALGIGILSHNLIESKDRVEVLIKEKSALSETLNEKKVIISNYQARVEELDKRVSNLDKHSQKLSKQVKEYEKKERLYIKSDKRAKAKIKELERLLNVKQQEAKKKVVNQSRSSSKGTAQSSTFSVTNYTVNCTGCTGITKSGKNVRNTIYHNGMRVVATDTSIIPLGSIIEISVAGNAFKAQALDIGGAIKGYEIDLLVSSNSEAVKFGRKKASVKVLRRGW